MKKYTKKLNRNRFPKYFVMRFACSPVSSFRSSIGKRFGKPGLFGKLFGKPRLFTVLILSAFILSSIISVHIITNPFFMKSYDGSSLHRIASSELGNEGGEKYWRWCGFDERAEWCACFVSWCLSRCYENFPKISSCDDFVRFIKENNGWYGREAKPVPGMIVFFDFDGDKRPEHMGIADRFTNDKIYVIEGNSGDRCELNVYDPHDKSILGYGVLSPLIS